MLFKDVCLWSSGHRVDNAPPQANALHTYSRYAAGYSPAVPTIPKP